MSFSQDLAAGRYPQQEESNPSPLILFLKLYFIIIIPSIPWSCKRFFFRLSHQTFARVCIFCHACYMSRPPHILSFDHPIVCQVQIMKPQTSFISLIASFLSSACSQTTSFYVHPIMRHITLTPIKRSQNTHFILLHLFNIREYIDSKLDSFKRM